MKRIVAILSLLAFLGVRASDADMRRAIAASIASSALDEVERQRREIELSTREAQDIAAAVAESINAEVERQRLKIESSIREAQDIAAAVAASY